MFSLTNWILSVIICINIVAVIRIRQLNGRFRECLVGVKARRNSSVTAFELFAGNGKPYCRR